MIVTSFRGSRNHEGHLHVELLSDGTTRALTTSKGWVATRLA